MTITLDPEKQKQARQYARIRRRLWLVDTILSAVYFLAWIVFGWSIALRTWLTDTWPLFTNPWGCRARENGSLRTDRGRGSLMMLLGGDVRGRML